MKVGRMERIKEHRMTRLKMNERAERNRNIRQGKEKHT